MASNKQTILLCEDEEFVARSYIRKLELEGYTVIHALNGSEALLKLEERPLPHLIILDLMMPIKSGFEVLTEIKQNENKEITEIPVIIASNLGQKSDMDEAKKLGAVDFLVKSNISLKELAQKIEEHLHVE